MAYFQPGEARREWPSMESVRWGFGQPGVPSPQPTPRVCDNRSIPQRGTIQELTAGRVACTPQNAFGVTDSFRVIKTAVARAVEMLDNTIGELVDARNAVCAGATPAWPLLGDITLEWLTDRLGVCIDDIRVWTAGTFVNGSVAEVIRRLVRVRNLIASNVIRYVCGGRCVPADPTSGCVPGDWAFVCLPQPCPPGAVPTIVHLCRNFWQPGVRADGKRVDLATHAEFQAQTIIHEASHLYHCTSDAPGSTIGVAECLAQFVAATNGSPLDPIFRTRCAVTNRCAPAARVGLAMSTGFGAASTGSVRIVRTTFRPQNAIRLKGRPAVRR
jgi:hypothetical protein